MAKKKVDKKKVEEDISDEEFERQMKLKQDAEEKERENNRKKHFDNDDDEDNKLKNRLWISYKNLHEKLKKDIPYSKYEFLKKDIELIRDFIEDLRYEMKEKEEEKKEDKKEDKKKDKKKDKEEEEEKKERKKRKRRLSDYTIEEIKDEETGEIIKVKVYDPRYSRWLSYKAFYKKIDKEPKIEEKAFLRKSENSQIKALQEARNETMEERKNIIKENEKKILKELKEKDFKKLDERQKKFIISQFYIYEQELLEEDFKLPKFIKKLRPDYIEKKQKKRDEKLENLTKKLREEKKEIEEQNERDYKQYEEEYAKYERESDIKQLKEITEEKYKKLNQKQQKFILEQFKKYEDDLINENFDIPKYFHQFLNSYSEKIKLKKKNNKMSDLKNILRNKLKLAMEKFRYNFINDNQEYIQKLIGKDNYKKLYQMDNFENMIKDLQEGGSFLKKIKSAKNYKNYDDLKNILLNKLKLANEKLKYNFINDNQIYIEKLIGKINYKKLFQNGNFEIMMNELQKDN